MSADQALKAPPKLGDAFHYPAGELRPTTLRASEIPPSAGKKPFSVVREAFRKQRRPSLRA